MYINKVLLGAAAFVALGVPAFSADAIVAAEPEPVEYVRVCDAFGNGYFYIPGTETCLRISGYVWFQLGGGTDDDSWENGNTSTRARVNIDARSDTEWGELASRIRLQGTWNTNSDGPNISAASTSTSNTQPTNKPTSKSNARPLFKGAYEKDVRQESNSRKSKDPDDALSEEYPIIPYTTTTTTTTTGSSNIIDQAWLRLGGLFMGYSESYWANAYNTGASNWGSHSWGGLGYGYQQRHLIAYTYNNGTFFIAASAEDDDDATNWTPDFTGKIGAAFGGATIWLKAGYDDLNADSGTDGYGIGAGVAFDLGPGNLRVLGYYANAMTDYAASNGLTTPEWSAIVSYGMDLSANLYGSVGGQYWNNFYCPIDTADCATNAGSGQDGWAAEASVVWTPVTNFSIRGEVTYTDLDPGLIAGGGDSTTGFVRVQRAF